MLQQRLAHSIDHLLHPNQYGFRAGRSISIPLFLLRRLTEIFERHPPLSISYSWTGPRLLTQSDIHNIWQLLFAVMESPPLVVDAIMAPYQNCQFFVTDSSSGSPYFPLVRGIRTGCPLCTLYYCSLHPNIRPSLLFPWNLLLHSMDIFQLPPTDRC